jgi:hypothetical protein
LITTPNLPTSQPTMKILLSSCSLSTHTSISCEFHAVRDMHGCLGAGVSRCRLGGMAKCGCVSN